MTLKTYLWSIFGGALLSLIALGLVIAKVDPQTAGFLGQLMFYASAFLFFSGMFVFIFTLSRMRWSAQVESMSSVLAASFRQGILLALLCIILLLMQSFRVLTWWDGLLVLAGILLVELYFLARK